MITKYGKFEYALAEHYRFEGELGRGAMGTVYRAKDMRLGRPVAIKILHPLLTNELGIARFQSEIRIAAGLHHPNIVGVHDSGEADGCLFYVMDYLGGETLRVRLQREKQLAVEDALEIVGQVADGLQYAHDHGVVHRDIKPENILLCDGTACVVDFGLARALGDVSADRLTASGLSVGTPHYLSPEQAAAEREVGPRADQYGLACVLYEMLIGEPPFTGPTATSIAMRHITEEPRPLRIRRHTTPTGVEAAVMRALEKVPADRFGTVREFASFARMPLQTVRDDRSARSPRVLDSRRVSRALKVFASVVVVIGAAAIGIATRNAWLPVTTRTTSQSLKQQGQPASDAPRTPAITETQMPVNSLATPKPVASSFVFPSAQLRVRTTGLSPTMRGKVEAALRNIVGVQLIDDATAAAHLALKTDAGMLAMTGPDGEQLVSRADAASITSALLPLIRYHLARLDLEALDTPDSKRGLQLHFADDKQIFVVGDEIQFRVRSERTGYLTLIDLAPDGSVTILHPSGYLDVGRVSAGKEIDLPGSSGAKFPIALPAGRGLVRAIITDGPLALARNGDLIAAQDGSVITAKIRRAVEKQIRAGASGWVTTVSPYAIRP